MIMMNSTQKPYAQTTLKRKYKDTGLSQPALDRLHTLLLGCVNFYKIVDVDHAFLAVEKVSGGLVSREQFEAVLSVDARNDSVDYYLYPESCFYEDGSDDILLLTAPELLVAENEHFTESDSEKLKQFMDEGGDMETYEGELPFCDDDEKFDMLYSRKVTRQAYYYPADLAAYAEDGYYEKTAQTEQMKDFLLSLRYSDFDADDILFDMVDILCDCGLPDEAGPEMCLEVFTGDGIKLSGKQQNTFAALYTALCDNTRMPVNNGFTNRELNAPAMEEKPSANNEALAQRARKARKAILDLLDMPEDIKEQILQQSAEGGLPLGKVGRNDPCPCGSGKKYKKCCGK